MALLTVRVIPDSGSAFNLVAVNATDTIPGDQVNAGGGLVLDVNNGNAASCVVTIGDPGKTPAGNPAPNSPAGKQITITTGLRRQIFVGPANVDPVTNTVTVTYSVQTTVTAEAYRF